MRAEQTRVQAASAEVDTVKKGKKEVEEEEFDLDGPDFAPTTQQVQDFLHTLCEDTAIAQVELKMGTFALKVRRNLDGLPSAPGAVPAAPAAIAPDAGALALPPVPYQTIDDVSAEDSIDEALVYVTSPKVGIFRRGKYAGGKRVGKGNIAQPTDQVKRGQALGFVEQLGTFVPVAAPQAGEVVVFKVQDGEAVEYNQVVVELAPFFGGHIIGDSKHA